MKNQRPCNSTKSDRPSVGGLLRRRHIAWLLLAWLTFSGAGGCGGCRPLARRPAPDPDKPEVEKPKLKPDFEFVRLASLPSNKVTADLWIKPGHWTAATLDAVAHNFDYQAELRADFQAVSPVAPFQLETSRPASLPKGQTKQFELVAFGPTGLFVGDTVANLNVRLTPRGKTRSVMRESFPVRRLLPHQFHFVVLARDPDRYQYLRALDTFLPRVNEIFDPLESTHYFVLAPPSEQRAPLPLSALHWTTTAAVLWDDQDPAVLSPLQQQALVDWLHFGGQLVINGPATLDQLAVSFLAPYLPALPGPVRKITDADLKGLNDAWSFGQEQVQAARPWSGVTLIPHSDSETLVRGDEPLVVERMVGRGRVVATGFSLGQRELLGWDGLDGFWNGCLLRRGKRAYRHNTDGTMRVVWSGGTIEADADMRTARRVSRLRFFSRDAGVGDLASAQVANPGPVSALPFPRSALPEPLPYYGPPVAQWNQDGQVVQEAVAALRQAAGIDIPDQRFVLRILGGYLLVIVPVNWLLFRMLGRLEWAWAAIPVIALGGAAVVTRMAQLDIGFVRARTEVGIVELHGQHPRAHVTRYAALYASLTTAYTVTFDDDSAGAALPISGERGGLPSSVRSSLELRREQKPTLRGISVASNSMGILQAQHMHDLGGAIQLSDDGSAVVNHSSLMLEGVQVLRDGEVAWIGRLEPKQSLPLAFQPSQGRSGGITPSGQPATLPPIGIGPLWSMAERDREPGETRLLAWCSAPIDGVTIEPAAPQVRATNLVIAHLSPGRQLPAERDDNSRPAAERTETLQSALDAPAEGAP